SPYRAADARPRPSGALRRRGHGRTGAAGRARRHARDAERQPAAADARRPRPRLVGDWPDLPAVGQLRGSRREHRPGGRAHDVRVTVGCAGMIPEALNGDAAITTTVTAWAPDAPAAPSQPEVLRFFHGPGYRFPAGTPLLAGRVVDANGDPVARVRVFSTSSVHGVQTTEEVRSDDAGNFRLPLRWATGATDIKAALGGRNAAITISVPADLSTTQQMTLT